MQLFKVINQQIFHILFSESTSYAKLERVDFICPTVGYCEFNS